jgi:hypothetical protein
LEGKSKLITLLKQFLKKIVAIVTGAGALLFVGSMATSINVMAGGIDIDRANWSNDRDRLTVRGNDAEDDSIVTIRYGKKEDNGVVIGTTRADSDGDWRFRIFDIDPVPCDVTAEDHDDDDDKEVRRAPGNCSNDGGAPPPGNTPPVCSIDSPAGNITIAVGSSINYTATVTDADNDPLSISWSFNGGSPANSNAEDPGAVSYNATGNFTATLTASDGQASCVPQTRNIIVQDNVPPPVSNVSINSTSQNGIPGAPVSEQPLTGLFSHVLFSANDLGMHCGDFDTRISSVLPPFNVVHTQVIERGGDPRILTPADGVDVVYSASSNPTDPILAGINSAGSGPVLSSMLADGSVYKTNFWDVAREAYDPFYPSGILRKVLRTFSLQHACSNL